MENEKGKWTNNKLQFELSKPGAKTTGRKAELVERLESYERNENFSSRNTVFIPEDNPMPDWPTSGFHSLTLENQDLLPKITIKHIEQYILFRQVNNSGSNLDNSALKKGHLMSEDSVDAMSIYHQEVN